MSVKRQKRTRMKCIVCKGVRGTDVGSRFFRTRICGKTIQCAKYARRAFANDNDRD